MEIHDECERIGRADRRQWVWAVFSHRMGWRFGLGNGRLLEVKAARFDRTGGEGRDATAWLNPRCTDVDSANDPHALKKPPLAGRLTEPSNDVL